MKQDKFICTNCGLCCVDYDVVIIKPECVSDTIDLEDTKIYMHKPGYNPCPHLYWEGDQSRCKIHNYEWYEDTPCFQFTQIGDGECRLGVYIRDTKGQDHYKKYCDQHKEGYKNSSEFLTIL